MSNDLVPYEATPPSPSRYWTIRTWERTRRVGRTSKTIDTWRIVLEHIRDNGDKIRIEITLDNPTDLPNLKAFLDAAVELPRGIRVDIGTMESAPWDVIKPPTRFQIDR